MNGVIIIYISGHIGIAQMTFNNYIQPLVILDVNDVNILLSLLPYISSLNNKS